MNIQRTLSILSICFFFSFQNSDDKKVFAKEVIKVFKKDDTEGLYELYPSVADMKEILHVSAKGHAKEQMIDRFQQQFEEKKKQIQLNYQSIRERGEAIGINWKKVRLISTSIVKKTAVNNIQLSDIKINLESKGVKFVLLLDDCVYTEKRGWLILDKIAFWGQEE